MSEAETDALLDSKFFRGLVIAALLSGAGNGLVSLNKDTSDRFKGADFQREITTRDEAIGHAFDRLDRTDDSLHRHLEHSAQYTQIIRQHEKEIERLNELIARHYTQEH